MSLIGFMVVFARTNETMPASSTCNSSRMSIARSSNWLNSGTNLLAVTNFVASDNMLEHSAIFRGWPSLRPTRKCATSILRIELPTVGFGRIVYAPDERQSELTITVIDSWQRRGVARRLLDRLIEAARQKGDSKITARILAMNEPMLSLVKRRGFTLSDSEQGATVKLAQLSL